MSIETSNLEKEMVTELSSVEESIEADVDTNVVAHKGEDDFTSSSEPESVMKTFFAHLVEQRNATTTLNKVEFSREDGQRDACINLEHANYVGYLVNYRRPLELFTVPDFQEVVEDIKPTVACTQITGARLSLAADFRYDQEWYFRGLTYGDVSATISLAPSEKMQLIIKKTQRTQLNQTTINSSESLENFESSFVDKDVLNITRSTVQTQQWRVDGKANVSLGDGAFSFGASGGYGSSVQETSNRNVQRISEATQRSARRLQTLQKIEVARQVETLLENVQTRTFTNPYHDRSLTLFIYELSKEYVIQTRLAEIRPSLVFEINDLEMGEGFILGNGDFLTEKLLDRTLAAELEDALQAVRMPQRFEYVSQAGEYARMAFEYLFADIVIFNINDRGNPNPNHPSNSFNATLPNSGLDDAVNNQLGSVFATLNVYYHLYNNHGSYLDNEEQRSTMLIQLALALADSIKTDWESVTEDRMRNILDRDNLTEALRRVPAFLSLVEGMLKPLTESVDEERAAIEAADRARFTIQRVIGHLRCHKAFYVQAYLRYIFEHSDGFALSEAIASIVPNVNAAYIPTNIFQELNPQDGYIDGFQFIIPSKQPMTIDDALHVINRIRGDRLKPGHFDPDTIRVIVPTDGVHIEPQSGNCILRDIPEHTSSVKASIEVQAED